MAARGETPGSWLDGATGFLNVGGPVLWVLLGLSVAALSIILVKCWQFATLRPERDDDVHASLRLWGQGEHDKALLELDDSRPVAHVVGLAMRGLRAPGANRQVLKEEIERVASLELHRQRLLLPPLESIAMLSPLLGLLGTVLGMILAFQRLEAAGPQVDPSVLSSGIWRALLTTAFGLGVAIPVTAVHGWMERKVERVALRMNDAVTQVFTLRPGESQAAPTPDDAA